MTTSAEFLRELERVADSDGLYSGQFVKEALAAERRATVERIRVALDDALEGGDEYEGLVTRSAYLSILDEEAAR